LGLLLQQGLLFQKDALPLLSLKKLILQSILIFLFFPDFFDVSAAFVSPLDFDQMMLLAASPSK
jgi:hypothetical protein